MPVPGASGAPTRRGPWPGARTDPAPSFVASDGMAALLADVILVAHFGIAAFIAAGFVFVPMGAARRWRWVRSRPLRLAHLYAMLFIAAESVAGIACPLTVLEDLLRGGAAGSDGFIQRWIGRLLYWDAPTWFFV